MSKTSIFSDLRALGVELSPSKLRKTTMAELQAMLDAKHAEIAREQETRKAKRAASNKVVRLKPKAAAKPRTSRGVNLAPRPADQVRPVREGTVQHALIELLRDGATIWELQGATPKWTEASVKSGLYYDVHSIKGYGIRTEFMTPRAAYDAGHEAHCQDLLGTEDEYKPTIPVYFLVLPEGVEAPVYTSKPAPTKAAANKVPKATK